jgi:hypothetical protein
MSQNAEGMRYPTKSTLAVLKVDGAQVVAVLGVERDASARLVDLHAIAVVLCLIEPALALGQAIAVRRAG